MKYISILIILAAVACQTSSTQEENFNNVEKPIIKASTPVPKEEPSEVEQLNNNRGQTFMEFFSQFMWDQEFQRTRVIFPINVNKQQINSSAEWNHNSFYSSKSFIPILHSDTITYFDKDIDHNKVKMSIISFEKDNVENHFFSKKNGDWMLSLINTQTIDSVTEIDFITFLNKFSSDSLFQVEHVQFPLPNYYADPDNDYETTYDSISVNNWRHWNLTKTLEGMMSLNIKSKSPYRKIFIRGIENGIHVHYTFIQSRNNWKLIKIEDYST
jgi:hypothetical protein